jgi:hypothetical protein
MKFGILLIAASLTSISAFADHDSTARQRIEVLEKRINDLQTSVEHLTRSLGAAGEFKPLPEMECSSGIFHSNLEGDGVFSFGKWTRDPKPLKTFIAKAETRSAAEQAAKTACNNEVPRSTQHDLYDCEPIHEIKNGIIQSNCRYVE